MKNKKYYRFSIATAFAAIAAFMIVSACTGEQAKAKPNFIFKDAPKPGLAAKIGNEEITEDALISESKMDFMEIKKREYDLKLELLNRMVLEKLAGAEAKKANLSLNDYLEKKIIGEIKISDKEFKKFVAEKKIPESQLNPQLKERINSYMQQMKKQELVQAYVAKLTKNNKVEVYFSKPKLSVNVEVGKGPTFGKQGAKVTIVEFSDFQCPYCSKGAEILSEIKKKYGNKVLVAFRHFPLPMHPQARGASEASMCVNDQNTDKFWKYHDLLFKNQDKFDAANLEKFAKEVGADVKKFQDCVAAKKFANHISEDMAYGEKIGVKSTPTFFINGQLVAGALPFEQFAEMIDEELSAK